MLLVISERAYCRVLILLTIQQAIVQVWFVSGAFCPISREPWLFIVQHVSPRNWFPRNWFPRNWSGSVGPRLDSFDILHTDCDIR